MRVRHSLENERYGKRELLFGASAILAAVGCSPKDNCRTKYHLNTTCSRIFRMKKSKSSKPKSAKSRDIRSYLDFQGLPGLFWEALLWIGRLRTLLWLISKVHKYLTPFLRSAVRGLLDSCSAIRPLDHSIEKMDVLHSGSGLFDNTLSISFLIPKLGRILNEALRHENLAIFYYARGFEWCVPTERIGWVDRKGVFHI